jgi:hypothetical protein
MEQRRASERRNVFVAMATPLRVEIIVHAPTVFRHCQHCELVWQQTGFSRSVRAEQLRTGLPDDMRREYEAISRWAFDLSTAYGDRIAVDVIDATSPGGFWRSLRYGVHRLPAVVVDRREKFTGADVSSAGALIARRLGA